MFLFGAKNKKKTDNSKEKGGLLAKLNKGLSKSSNRIGSGIKDIFTKRRIDNDTLEELEDLLISSDLGVATSNKLTTRLKENKFAKEISSDEIKQELASIVEQILQQVQKPLLSNEIITKHKPYIILFCGVNGTGKTTTIGKIAAKLKNEGKTVLLAACDTFRAAAVEQLETWSTRAGCTLVKGKENADPASVAYNAIEQAKKDNTDIVLIDTAGRLQNKKHLMEQLAKIIRAIKKLDESAPHQNIIVLDATTGQNANQQVRTFSEMVSISGIIVTKLDGTAKGGTLVNIAKEFSLPIHAIGVGETIDDLQDFDAHAFSLALCSL